MDDNFNLPAPEKADPEMDLAYLTDRRDKELEHFNNGVKQYLTKKRLIERLDRVLRVNRQVKMMEDALVVYRVTQAKKKK